MNIGDKVKLIKKTFMHKGVFILSNSIVEIVDIIGENYNISYADKEGHPHFIENIKKADLEPLSN